MAAVEGFWYSGPSGTDEKHISRAHSRIFNAGFDSKPESPVMGVSSPILGKRTHKVLSPAVSKNHMHHHGVPLSHAHSTQHSHILAMADLPLPELVGQLMKAVPTSNNSGASHPADPHIKRKSGQYVHPTADHRQRKSGQYIHHLHGEHHHHHRERKSGQYVHVTHHGHGHGHGHHHGVHLSPINTHGHRHLPPHAETQSNRVSGVNMNERLSFQPHGHHFSASTSAFYSKYSISTAVPQSPAASTAAERPAALPCLQEDHARHSQMNCDDQEGRRSEELPRNVNQSSGEQSAITVEDDSSNFTPRVSGAQSESENLIPVTKRSKLSKLFACFAP